LFKRENSHDHLEDPQDTRSGPAGHGGHAGRGANRHHRDGVDHLDRAVGPVPHLLPEFKKATGIDVKVVAVGTGQAIDMARRGDADVLFVHDQPPRRKFVAEGFAIARYPVMYNDFVLVGPAADPGRRQRQGHRRGPEEDSPRRMRPSSRAATRAAPTRPSCATGKAPAETPADKPAAATRNAAAAWARR
jgi:tungstate transport system substrate-binding protein